VQVGISGDADAAAAVDAAQAAATAHGGKAPKTKLYEVRGGSWVFAAGIAPIPCASPRTPLADSGTGQPPPPPAPCPAALQAHPLAVELSILQPDSSSNGGGSASASASGCTGGAGGDDPAVQLRFCYWPASRLVGAWSPVPGHDALLATPEDSGGGEEHTGARRRLAGGWLALGSPRGAQCLDCPASSLMPAARCGSMMACQLMAWCGRQQEPRGFHHSAAKTAHCRLGAAGKAAL